MHSTICEGFELFHAPQGSPEWYAARRAAVTASQFKTARQWVGGLDEKQSAYVAAILSGKSEKDARAEAGYSAAPKAKAVEIALSGGTPGDFSEAGHQYARKIALECIGAQFPDQFETFAMRRGHELEPEARAIHEMELSMLSEDITSGPFIRQAGFVKTLDGRFGASADGLIDNDPDGPGIAEYKAFYDTEKVWPILFDDNWQDLADQVQGGLWITGRKWCDMCLYCPGFAEAGLTFTRKRVYRDEDYIESLEADLVRFYGLVEKYTAIARSKSKNN